MAHRGGALVAAAVMLQVKTVLDNADGQLARLTGRVTLLGRYLDSECDLLVNAAICAALAVHTASVPIGAAAFVLLTAVLGVNFNVERLHRQVHRGPALTEQALKGPVTRALARVYELVYGPQDRVVEAFVEWRVRRHGGGDQVRRQYHDRTTVALLANLGLSTQLAVLGVLLALGAGAAYVGFLLACMVGCLILAVRRERLVRAVRRPSAANT